MPELPKPACEGGYTVDQIDEIMAGRQDAFWSWMSGQTMMLCDGKLYDHEKKEYYDSPCGTAHGTVVYKHDVERFLAGLPVID